MKTRFYLLLRLLSLPLVAVSVARGQAVPVPASTPAPAEERVVLSPFAVTAAAVGRYQAGEALTGGRVRTSIFEADATIQVVTGALIEDLAGNKIIDAAKYIAGVSDSTLPAGLDRINLRGYRTQGQTIDGFYYSGQSNYDDSLIDRLEIVKGPNAVLSPAGTPGGTISIVSKKPQFTQRGSISATVGRYDADGSTLDVTGPVPILGGQKFAYRLVSSFNDADGYLINDRRRTFSLLPSLTARLGAATEITLIGEAFNYEAVASSGVPLDPLVGTLSPVRLFPGLARNWSPSVGDETRWERKRTLTVISTTRLAEGLNARLAARYLESAYNIFAPNTGISTPGGRIDPNTGFYVGGSQFAATAPFAASPAAQPTRNITRSGTFQTRAQYLGDVKNDYVYERAFGPVKSATTAGVSYSKYKRNQQQSNVTRGTQNVDTFVYGVPVTFSARNQHQTFEIDTTQYYAMQRLGFWGERLLVSGSVAPLSTEGRLTDRLNGRTFNAKSKVTDRSYGVVGKIRPEIALFYSYSEGSEGNAATDQVALNLAPAFSNGKQREVGLRFQLPGSRAYATLSHFDLDQNGQQVPNPGNLAVPPPPTQLPPLFIDRRSRGWEFNFSANLLKNLSLLGGTTTFRNRDPNGVPFAGTAERTTSALVRYDFDQGALQGFGLSVGVIYTGVRPGDTATGYTVASTPTKLIPNQPTFYLDAYTSVDLALFYKWGRWSFRVNVKNALDEEFLLAGTRTGIIAGNPRNLIFSTAYRF